jgi:competence protein ComGC
MQAAMIASSERPFCSGDFAVDEELLVLLLLLLLLLLVIPAV